MPTAQKAIAIGVFILIIGLAFPTFITAANTTDTVSMELSEGGSQDATDGLRVTADAVNATGSNVTLTDVDTYQKQTEDITTGDTSHYTIQGENVNVTVNSTDTTTTLNTTVLSIEHSPDYGWDSGAKTITENLGLFLAIVSLVIGGGILMSVIV